SVNTEENLRFASDIIAEENLPRNIVIISDGFHLWRAQMLAEDLFDEVRVIPSQTPYPVITTYWVREWFALTRDVFGLPI
ncbi:MAG: YdcF family protein, partial [Oscillospiraceae bacterium]|nr:YdcF family protein [Oscillospiraceae bacterium]